MVRPLSLSLSGLIIALINIRQTKVRGWHVFGPVMGREVNTIDVILLYQILLEVEQRISFRLWTIQCRRQPLYPCRTDLKVSDAKVEEEEEKVEEEEEGHILTI